MYNKNINLKKCIAVVTGIECSEEKDDVVTVFFDVLIDNTIQSMHYIFTDVFTNGRAIFERFLIATANKDFMHQWIDLYIKNQLSPTTVQHYIDQTENYIIPEFGDKYIQQLKNIDIQKWIFSLQTASPLTGKPLAPKTIKNIWLNLSAAMNKAVMLELIPKNPCDNITLPKLERFQPDVYSMDEVEKLLDCAKGTDMYLILMIEICLGLRRGELLALKWHHVTYGDMGKFFSYHFFDSNSKNI